MTEQAPRPRRTWIWVTFFALFLVFVYVIALGLYWIVTRSFSTPQVEVSRGTVLELDLSGPLSEGPPPIDFGIFGSVENRSMWGLRRALKAATRDRDIAGVLLTVRTAAIGWANAEEIVGLLADFREAGKNVYALLPGDMVSDLDYFLASAADRIWVTPETGIVINGLVAEGQFSRGSLEKLHIEPQVIMYKEYKSAGEMYSRHEMSPYMREALEAVLATMHERFIAQIEERRGVLPADLEAFMARGMATAPDLVAAGLADEIGYLDQVQEAWTELDDIAKFRSVGLARYLDTLVAESGGRQRIAVVFGEGPVLAQPAPSAFPFFSSAVLSGPAVASHIRRAAEDSRVQAIVFRVNSPGGSAVGSDLVRREIERARTSGKPVVVSMSDVAGSGGYWVAMDADAIVAHHTTITGSIGVVFQKLNLDGFFEWLGTNFDQVSTAPRADLLDFGPWEEGDEEAVLTWMDRIYDSFTANVARARELEMAHVQEVARGRIWSGRDALERRLVDRLGGFDDALALARELAGIDPERDVSLVIYPRPKPFFQRLLDDDWVTAARGLDASLLASWVERLSQPRVLAQTPRLRIH